VTCLLWVDAVDKIGGATGLVAPGCEAELVLCLYPHPQPGLLA
jgi:hypothetical protein